MKPALVLIIVFLISVIVTRFTGDYLFLYRFSGVIAMSAMLIFTAYGHFKFTTGMVAMLPAFIPAKKAIVLVTGCMEIILAIAILIPTYRVLSGYLLILFFVLILPANIIGTLKNINIENNAVKGPGIPYLWLRIPLQIVFIAWVYFCCIS